MNSYRPPRPRFVRAVAATCVACAAALTAAAPASAEHGALIDATPAEVVLDAPAPGESRTWAMSVTSTTDRTVALDLEITGQSDRLFGGEHPLQITISDPTGRPVLTQTDVAEVIDSSLELTDLSPGASRQLVGTVTLPSAAGNEYQGAGAALRLRFRAETDEVAKTPSLLALARTGPAFLVAAGVLAVLSVASGLTLMRYSRKTETHA